MTDSNDAVICAICRDAVGPSSMGSPTTTQRPCGHIYCRPCYASHVKYVCENSDKFRDRGRPTVRCPQCARPDERALVDFSSRTSIFTARLVLYALLRCVLRLLVAPLIVLICALLGAWRLGRQRSWRGARCVLVETLFYEPAAVALGTAAVFYREARDVVAALS